MRLNRKAVTDLPIKLLVISILLSVSLPILAGAVDSSERNMDVSLMEDEAARIGNAVAAAYYTSYGGERYIEVDIPDGCSIVLGGEGDDAYAMHMMVGGEVAGVRWMENPLLPFYETVTVSGHGTLCVSADDGGIRVAAA